MLLALALLAGAAAAEAPGGRLQRIEERGRLIVGVKADYPPWGMVAPDGSIVGLEADLARDAAERLGVELELVPVTAGNRLQRLEQGQVDLVIATLGDTAERRHGGRPRAAALLRERRQPAGAVAGCRSTTGASCAAGRCA